MMRRTEIYMFMLFLAMTLHGRAQSPSGAMEFWRTLKTYCGKAFEGELVTNTPDDSWKGKRIVMHVRSCEDNRIRIPLMVGDDRSRTWVLTWMDGRILLKHDHRHEDGSPDQITMYGGQATSSGLAHMQVFPADQETCDRLPRAATNVWWMTLTDEVFTYNVRRLDSEVFFSIKFDLTKHFPAPEAPWGWGEGTR
jgi:hypothetical protein